MMPSTQDILRDVHRALQEDIGPGDVTAALLPAHLLVDAIILSREPMFIAGIPWVDAVFHEVDASVRIEWLVQEGSWIDAPETLCHIHGSARSILTGERTALNFLQTLSGTATQTYHYVSQISSYPTRLLDTRKTLPGLRLAQKYAVSCAGGQNHRMGLYDAFLIKENHITACGSITKAVDMAKRNGKGLFVEVEVETLIELEEALACYPDRILLDNFTLPMLKEAVRMNQPRRSWLEASGGVAIDTIASMAATGVDYISVGALTKSVQSIDLSLLLEDNL